MAEVKEAVIVSYGRSAIGRGGDKGSLRDLHPVDMGGLVLKEVVARAGNKIDPKTITDFILGCARPVGPQGSNMGRIMALRAGLPWDVSSQTLTRFCSSGLQAISTAANWIMSGQGDMFLAGGIEKMTGASMGTPPTDRSKWIDENEKGIYMPMGITAENVADKYGITRQEMDQLAVDSHKKAAAAIKAGKFKEEIVPLPGVDADGKAINFDTDQGVRANTTLEGLGALKPAFKPEGGKVTAGQSSQVSDGCGFVMMMSAGKAKELGVTPVARFVGFAVAGVDPSHMGIGPIYAVPKVMALTGLKISDMSVIEINEAFAAQAIPCIRELKLPMEKVNPNGGAIALGHPLGGTGGILTSKAIGELKRTKGRYALITMCVGGGMGAAGIIERL